MVRSVRDSCCSHRIVSVGRGSDNQARGGMLYRPRGTVKPSTDAPLSRLVHVSWVAASDRAWKLMSKQDYGTLFSEMQDLPENADERLVEDVNYLMLDTLNLTRLWAARVTYMHEALRQGFKIKATAASLLIQRILEQACRDLKPAWNNLPEFEDEITQVIERGFVNSGIGFLRSNDGLVLDAMGLPATSEVTDDHLKQIMMVILRGSASGLTVKALMSNIRTYGKMQLR
jgi:hypothetical protein